MTGFSQFQEGDRVRSLVDAQDLRLGETYTVVQVNTNFAASGEVVQYDVQDDDGEVVAVTGGHLVLERIEEGE